MKTFYIVVLMICLLSSGITGSIYFLNDVSESKKVMKGYLGVSLASLAISIILFLSSAVFI